VGLGTDPPFENIITPMPNWSSTACAYGEKRARGGAGTRSSFTGMLYSERFGPQPKRELTFSLPVRGQTAR